MATKTDPRTLTVQFTKERDTKNTVRYNEDVVPVAEGGPFDGPVIGTLYVQKYAATQMGNPDKITITVEVSK